MDNMNTATAAPTVKLPAPIEVLRANAHRLGYTLSTDTDTLWNNLYNRTYRNFKRCPTRGEMRTVVTNWIAWVEAKQREHAKGTV